MHARHHVIDVFSTFIEFELDYFSRWVTDARLRRHMEQRLTTPEHAQLSATLWANYWHRIHRQYSGGQGSAPASGLPTGGILAKGHLVAYLQETCYWATQKIIKLLPTQQLEGADCFQIAIAEVDTILLKYEPHRGSSLKGFAAIAYPRLLRDILRRRRTAEISTDHTLLARVSKRCLLDALKRAGLSQQEIAQYRLAWTCFKAIYGQPAPQAQAPQAQAPQAQTPAKQIDWPAIAALYNSERLQQLDTRADAHAPALAAATLQARLGQCAKWVRAYLTPAVISLNRPQTKESPDELQETIPASCHDSLLSDLISQEESLERQLQWSKLRQVLVDAIATFPPHQQSLLQLYYQDHLTQQQIAQQLKLKQYTISRQLTRIRTALLDTLVSNLAQWSDASLHRPFKADLSKSISPILEEWLTTYYGTSTESSPD